MADVGGEEAMMQESRGSVVRPCLHVLFVVLWMFVPAISTAQDDAEASGVEDDLVTKIGTVNGLSQAPGPFQLSLSLSYDEKSGNTNTRTSSVGFSYSKFWDSWGAVSNGTASLSESDTTDEESFDFDLYVTRKLSDRFSLILVEEWKRDVFKGLESQNVVGIGVLWTAVDKKKWSMTLHGAPAWASERPTDAEGYGFAVGVVEWQNTITISSNTASSLVTSFYYNFDDSEDYRVDASLQFDAAMTSTFGWKLAYEVDYDHRPVADSLTTDRSFSASLTIAWKGPSSSGSSNGSDPPED